MLELIGISTYSLFGQLLVGLINGAFYAILSLGLAVIFGLLNPAYPRWIDKMGLMESGLLRQINALGGENVGFSG